MTVNKTPHIHVGLFELPINDENHLLAKERMRTSEEKMKKNGTFLNDIKRNYSCSGTSVE